MICMHLELWAFIFKISHSVLDYDHRNNLLIIVIS